MPAPRSAAFARQLLKRLSGRENVVLCGRAASGIWATLRAFGYTQRRILIPANTCYVVLWAVLESGNIPVLVDVDPATANLDVDLLERTNTTDAAVLIPAHMYGFPAPMERLCAWAQERGIVVIEDAALALGGSVDGQPVGAWGDVSVFSFGQGKTVDNVLGGALVTSNPELSERIARQLTTLPHWNDALMALANQWHNLYWALHQHEAENPRLLNLYPALFDVYRPLVNYQLAPSEWNGLPKLLSELPANLQHRHEMANLYDEQLRGLPVRTFAHPQGTALWRYPLLIEPEQRDTLLATLWENGITDATRWYPSLRYMASVLAPDAEQSPTPNADLLGASIINLRVDSGVDAAYIERVAQIISEFFEA